MATVLDDVLPKSRVLLCVFLWAKGLNAKDIHKEIFPVYGGKCLSRKAVHNWVEKFSQGRSKVADDIRPGLPVEILVATTARYLYASGFDALVKQWNKWINVDGEYIEK
jgi:hypothetical protein